MAATAAAELAAGWGSPALRRATFALAATQLVSWGVLFYGFAVVAPEVTADTGWSETVVAGAFSLGLLVAGIAAPAVARHLARHDPRLVLTAGSLLGIAGMAAFAGAHHIAVLYVAWLVIGLAMAATLYEPAMAVLVALDPTRRHRTLAVVTVAGGLASTVFAPLGGVLVDEIGWRFALLVLAVAGGVFTTVLHAAVLPAARAVPAPPEPVTPSVLRSNPVRRLQLAQLFEQAAILATTAHYIGLLVDRGTTIAVAGAVLAAMGLGKVAGRLLLLGPVVRALSLPALAAGCNLVQLAGLAVPLVTTRHPALFLSAVVVGAASGATTVLRPLLVVELVGPGPYAAVSAHLQRNTTVGRAGAPLAIGLGATAIGWPATWILALTAFGIAARHYERLGARTPITPA
jgi:predicted MFS family arabinose efflux permease